MDNKIDVKCLIIFITLSLAHRTSTLLLRIVSSSPESLSTKKKREMLQLYKTKMDMMNKRIEEAKEKWNIVQTESISTNKQFYGQRSFRLTLEQELVIKGNLSEMYRYNIYIYYTLIKIYNFFLF